MSVSRRTFVAGTAAVLASPAIGQAAFPNKPIRMVVPYAPGGASDLAARTVGEAMSKRLGQPIVVEYRPGASQMIAMEYTFRAPPDGYTLVMASEDATALMPYLRTSMPYEMPDAFSYISRVTNGSYMIVGNPNRPWKTIQEFIAYAKANPNQVKYATAGPGTAGHIVILLLEQAAGIKTNHIAYKGGAPSLTDTIAGVTDATTGSYSQVAGHAEGGRVRLMVCTGATRQPLAPDVPSMTDLGYPGATVTNWLGILGPAGIPQEVQAVLQKTARESLLEADVKGRFEKAGFDPTPVIGDDFKKLVISQMAKWKSFAATSGIRLE